MLNLCLYLFQLSARFPVSGIGVGGLRLRLHDDRLNTRRKSGVASYIFIPRLDKRFREEMVTQKCVEFDWVCMSDG